MPYREIHLRSSQSDRMQTGSNFEDRDHPLFELADPLELQSFAVKYVDLPLTFKKRYNDYITFNMTSSTGSTYTWTINIDEDLGNGDEFSARLTYLFLVSIGSYAAATPPIAGDPSAPPATDLGQGATDDPYFAQHEGEGTTFYQWGLHLNHGTVNTITAFSITWGPQFAKKFELHERHTTGPVTWTGTPNPKKIANRDWVVLSPQSISLTDNFVYLHSNLMSSTPYASQTRPLGGFASRTILAKIPIPTHEVISGQTWGWQNETLGGEFFYECSVPQITYLEFWFTDQEDEEITFSGVPFAITLSCIY